MAPNLFNTGATGVLTHPAQAGTSPALGGTSCGTGGGGGIGCPGVVAVATGAVAAVATGPLGMQALNLQGYINQLFQLFIDNYDLLFDSHTQTPTRAQSAVCLFHSSFLTHVMTIRGKDMFSHTV